MKKVVQYSEILLGPVKGQRAVVIPIDHPDKLNVSNNLPATTTSVVSYDEVTGQFETANTLYVPA